MQDQVDVVVIGAGAAGLMCAITAGYRGRSVRILDHANKPGKKILMSGGGKCNFTHLNSTPANFLSDNPAYCISALKRYTPHDFLEWVDRHGIGYYEKTPGQLFCATSSKDILQMLLTEAEWAGVDIAMNTQIKAVEETDTGYQLHTSSGIVSCASLVVATGGLSIPTLGASPFGYQLAEQFGLQIRPTRAGLVPFTLQPDLLERFAPLSGVSCPIEVSHHSQLFREPMLFTHRGVSGPAMLQISSFWHPGEALRVNLLPELDLVAVLKQQRHESPKKKLETILSQHLPKRLAQILCEWHAWPEILQQCSNETFESITESIQQWALKPNGTEGYRTAEVTLGGVDTRQLSSKTMAVEGRENLFFIGEVVDITGHLGGHNFQWAWASGFCAGQYV
ncbi:flavoprotein [Oleiphilus messinensis]|uniref:Flavoprotein n=1 Tax=Oleiphilus messinensis TaxID=141451 RepID=A0A1Y0I203_9GAMM|nr:NAD(P)/FAD-dependent oxidoreductase [Oleiphilus messinensis]ARU54497.1 flavoprotein [Oleiphilus messinensis]